MGLDGLQGDSSINQGDGLSFLKEAERIVTPGLPKVASANRSPTDLWVDGKEIIRGP